jgi:hypothetical protein
VSSSWQARTIAEFHSIPQLRMCASVRAEANLAFTIYGRTRDELAKIELDLGQRIPRPATAGTMVYVRSHKRMGGLIGPDGRCTGEGAALNIFSPD